MKTNLNKEVGTGFDQIDNYMKSITLSTKSNCSSTAKTIDNFFASIPGIENASAIHIVNASDLSPKKFINDWVSKNKPCLIKGAVKDWPAVNKWKEKEYWLKTCKDSKVEIFFQHNCINEKNIIKKPETMTFHEAIERLHEDRDDVFSLPAEVIKKNNSFSKLLEDINGFSFLPNAPRPRLYPQQRFFMYRRAATSWHYHDIDESLMCQINGSKKVVLLSARIPNPKSVTEFFARELYWEGKKMDSSLDLKPVIVDVEEGDALYIPPYWFHGVVPNDDEIGYTLAYCWKSPIHILGNYSNYFVRMLYRSYFLKRNLFAVKLIFSFPFAAISYYTKKIQHKI